MKYIRRFLLGLFIKKYEIFLKQKTGKIRERMEFM